jgi:predicted O-methyltransferase YrrM
MGIHYWRQAGVESRIDRRICPAEEILSALIKEGEASSFDMIFIDANRAGYVSYLRLSAVLLHPGGLLIADNLIRLGKVIDAADTSPETEAVRQFNKLMYDDPRFQICMLPIADGMTLAIKK